VQHTPWIRVFKLDMGRELKPRTRWVCKLGLRWGTCLGGGPPRLPLAKQGSGLPKACACAGIASAAPACTGPGLATPAPPETVGAIRPGSPRSHNTRRDWGGRQGRGRPRSVVGSASEERHACGNAPVRAGCWPPAYLPLAACCSLLACPGLLLACPADECSVVASAPPHRSIR